MRGRARAHTPHRLWLNDCQCRIFRVWLHNLERELGGGGNFSSIRLFSRLDALPPPSLSPLFPLPSASSAAYLFDLSRILSGRLLTASWNRSAFRGPITTPTTNL